MVSCNLLFMKIRRVTSEKFKQSIENNEPEETIQSLAPVKGLVTQVDKAGSDVDERILQFVISTGDVDRDGDTLDPNGWELDNFNKGGSMLWAHDPRQVIARPLATWLEDGRLKSRAQFMPKEMNPFSFMHFEMFRDGYVRGVSVGFLPKEWKENADRGGWMPLDFLRQELLEYSGTPVPSNPNALREAKSKGIDVDPFMQWLEPMLDGETPAGLLVDRELAEQMYRSVKGDAPVVVEATPPAAPAAPESAVSILKDWNVQIEKASAMIANKTSELADEIVQLVEIVGNQSVVLSGAAREKLKTAAEALVSILGGRKQAGDDDDDNFDFELDESDDDDVIEFDDGDIQAALGDIIQESVRTSIRHQMGRVD